MPTALVGGAGERCRLGGMRKVGSALLCAALLGGTLAPARADAYHASPKLVVEVVIDQFRGDLLLRYADDFKTPSGFNLFLKRGAVFPNCYFDYDNTMTAPGHSSIGTGAYSNGHGIALNEWWDLKRSTTHPVSSVEDERYQIVGDHGPDDAGTSPRNELASTLGDEVVLATGGRSKLFGISLKDRAAILTSGHASNGAFWLDHASGHFVSSTYWGKELPGWVQQFNGSGRTEQAEREAKVGPGHFYDQVGPTPASVSYLMDFAKSLVSAEQMGRHGTTDVLTISISSTDLLGHRVGPDAPEQRAMIDAIDVDLNDFFGWLDKHVDGGMGNVWVSLTGDHGVGPALPAAHAARMPAALYNLKQVYADVNGELNTRYSPGKAVNYLLPTPLPYLMLDPRPFEARKVSEAEAEDVVAELIPAAFDRVEQGLADKTGERAPVRGAVRHVYTHLQIAAGNVPNTPEGRRVLHSFSPNERWSVMLEPSMYSQASASGTNHYTAYAYDRHVPLAFFGRPFVPGRYPEASAPVDIAPTFAVLLGVNLPSNAVGRVLGEALQPEAAGPARVTRHGGHE